MKSHEYDFSRTDLLQVFGPLLVGVAVCAGLLHLAARAGLMPTARPAYDVEHTIVLHKAQMVQQSNPAEVVLIGDSSCLMDLSARQMGDMLKARVLNLGTLSYLDLRASASLLTHYAAANPGSPRAVVLLMHPEALRRVGSESYYTNFLQSIFSGAIPPRIGTTVNPVTAVLGLDELKSRVVSRILPVPFAGAYGRAYGFNRDLERYLDEQRGSLIDPDPRPFQGNAEYSLVSTLHPASRAFRTALPKEVRLFVGITPVPEKFAKANYPEVHKAMLKQWSEWLDGKPLPLPAILPAEYFAKTTHLNRAGIEAYTRLVADALKRELQGKP